jgi:hypothetical protein
MVDSCPCTICQYYNQANLNHYINKIANAISIYLLHAIVTFWIATIPVKLTHIQC